MAKSGLQLGLWKHFSHGVRIDFLPFVLSPDSLRLIPVSPPLGCLTDSPLCLEIIQPLWVVLPLLIPNLVASNTVTAGAQSNNKG